MQKQQLLYQGKAKSLYATDNPDYLVVEFRDDTSAFDGVKVEKLADKGQVNNQFNAFIMDKLKKAGIPVHHDTLLNENESVVKHLNMLAVECVVRNFSAGSLCRRLGIEEGQILDPPIYELFLKNDELHDPAINESIAITFGWATEGQLAKMKTLSLKINDILKAMFLKADLLLVDFKLEFGLFKDEITLGDEITPDGCRIWDKGTLKKLDKDRFRKDLGDVITSYKEVFERLKVK